MTTASDLKYVSDFCNASNPRNENLEEKLEIAQKKLAISSAGEMVRHNPLMLPNALHVLCDIGEDKENTSLFVRSSALCATAEMIFSVHQKHNVQNVLNELNQRGELESLDLALSRLHSNVTTEHPNMDTEEYLLDTTWMANAAWALSFSRDLLFYSLVRYDMKTGSNNVTVKTSLYNEKQGGLDISYKKEGIIDLDLGTNYQISNNYQNGVPPRNIVSWIMDDIIPRDIDSSLRYADRALKSPDFKELKPELISIKHAM